jgi:hypothetical protein
LHAELLQLTEPLPAGMHVAISRTRS